MKFLMGLLGDQVDSLVAKRFEHATWFMIIDGETMSGEAARNQTPHDRQEILRKAADQNADGVVAGKFGEHSRKLIRNSGMRILQVHGMSGRMAMMKAQAGELPLLSLEDGQDKKEMSLGTVQRPSRKAGSPTMAFTNPAYSSDSPRGNHHIQQYGGRGH